MSKSKQTIDVQLERIAITNQILGMQKAQLAILKVSGQRRYFKFSALRAVFELAFEAVQVEREKLEAKRR